MSAPADELGAERDRLQRALAGEGYNPYFSRRTQDLVRDGAPNTYDACVQAIGPVDYFVHIQGGRRDVLIDAGGRSLSEEEHAVAYELGKPIIHCCVASVLMLLEVRKANEESIDYPATLVDPEAAESILRFLEEIQEPGRRDNWVHEFDGGEELCDLVSNALNEDQRTLRDAALSEKFLEEAVALRYGPSVAFRDPATALDRLAEEGGIRTAGALTELLRSPELAPPPSDGDTLVASLVGAAGRDVRTPLIVSSSAPVPRDGAEAVSPSSEQAYLDHVSDNIRAHLEHAHRGDYRQRLEHMLRLLRLQHDADDYKRELGERAYAKTVQATLEYLWDELVQDEILEMEQLEHQAERNTDLYFYCIDTAFDDLQRDVWSSEPHHLVLLGATRLLATHLPPGHVVRLSVVRSPEQLARGDQLGSVAAFCRQHLDGHVRVGFVHERLVRQIVPDDLIDFFVIPGTCLYQVYPATSVHVITRTDDVDGPEKIAEYVNTFEELLQRATMIDDDNVGRLDQLLTEMGSRDGSIEFREGPGAG